MKKIISIICAAMVLFASSVSAYKIEVPQSDIDGEEVVTLIVEVEGEALLGGEEELQRYSLKTRQDTMLGTHAEVMSEVNEKVDEDARTGYVYTALFNGFSIDTDSSNIEKIKEIPGVKNVYIAGESYIVEPYLESSSDMIHSSHSYELGYKGEGMAVAIIDAGCDTGHKFFETAPQNPKYTKSTMKTKIESVRLNSGVADINRVYKSEKIPYAYNYVSNSSDTYLSGQHHGTHVAGIVAGKNGMLSDGTTFSGVAPEAQLFIMSCGTAKGSISNAAVVAALNDAALLGADVINMSFGVDYVEGKSTFSYSTILSNARSAGIVVMASAGNAARGFYETETLTKNIDYSATGIPANHSSVMSVASAGTTDGGQISSFSSWGVDSSLQIKPEITAPGGSICSSVNGDRYGVMSGTSMATPHMSGVAALALQYYKSNPYLSKYNNVTGADKVALVENIMMNSADIVRKSNGVAASPRQQGAGLINVENMLKSKVLIKGDSGKAKLSLGDKVGSTLNISFDINNISGDTVRFDEITAEIMTDGYYTKDGKNYVGELVPLEIVSETLSDTVTIAPGESYVFKGKIVLDDNALKKNKKIFENGFFIDGFITMRGQGERTKASLPFVGFYGEWGTAPVFDTTIYDEGGSQLLVPDDKEISGTYLLMTKSGGKYVMGRNLWFEELCDKKYISFSSSSAMMSFITTNHRAMNNYSYKIKKASGTTVYQTSKGTTIADKYVPLEYMFEESGTKRLAEGDYEVSISANTAGDTDVTHILSLPVVVDNTSPQICAASYDEQNKKVNISAKDNHYIATIYARYTGANGEAVTKYGKITDTDYTRGEMQTVSLDVSDITDEESISIGVYDYAINGAYSAIDYYDDLIGAELWAIRRVDGMTSATINIRNNDDEDVAEKFILAFYDSENALVEMDCQDVTIAAGEEKSIKYSMFKDTQNASYAKLFVWDFGRLKPYDRCKRFDLE